MTRPAKGTEAHRAWVLEWLRAYATQPSPSMRGYLAWAMQHGGPVRRDLDALGGYATALAKAAGQPAPTRPVVRRPVYSAEPPVSVRDIEALDVDLSELDGEPPLVIHAPPEEIDVDELVGARKDAYERKRAHEEALRLIPIDVRIRGPIGILWFGDPHLDDDGTDLAAVERHALAVRNNEALFGASLGDVTNNWIGRLGRLYGEQSTTARQAWALAEWFVRLTRDWILLVGGNHDAWSGAGDPLQWIASQAQALYQSSEVRAELRFPNGRKVRINARHDFAGSSQWNPAHGSMKAAQFGFHDHILINGHKHVSGYGVIKDPANGTVSHCIQCASYKVFDRYAKERGFRDQHISPAVVTVIDPTRDETGLVTVFHDIDEGVDYLRFKRSKVAA